MDNYVVWFEIPVKDLKRAMKFYSQVMQVELKEVEAEGSQMAFFPFSPNGVSGALVMNPDNNPSEKGTLIYLNGGEDLAGPLGKIEKAGGKVLQGKTSIGQYGFIAYFRDTEGNRVALHSMQ